MEMKTKHYTKIFLKKYFQIFLFFFPINLTPFSMVLNNFETKSYEVNSSCNVTL